MGNREYRVGELAKMTGVTVRTLHHWEEVGLLSPTRRTAAGHRIYGSQALDRVQSIRSMKAVGMSLDQIRDTLHSSEANLGRILRAHRTRIQDQIHMLMGLDARLGKVLTILEREGEIRNEELLKIMEAMTAIERHFTREQLQILKSREEAMGPEAIRAAQEEWPRLIAGLRRSMEEGLDPGNPKVREMAARWQELVHAFSGGNSAIEESLGTMYRDEPRVAEGQGLSAEIFAYLEAARKRGA